MRGEWQKHIALRCAPARTADAVIFIGSDEQMFAQINKSRTGCEATKKRESSVSLQGGEMTKEEQVVGLIFQVTMWAYIAAAAAYVVIG